MTHDMRPSLSFASWRLCVRFLRRQINRAAASTFALAVARLLYLAWLDCKLLAPFADSHLPSKLPCSPIRSLPMLHTKLTLPIASLLVLTSVSLVRAADPPAPVAHKIMVCEYSDAAHRLVEIGADGKLNWEHKFP